MAGERNSSDNDRFNVGIANNDASVDIECVAMTPFDVVVATVTVTGKSVNEDVGL
jgi:hypothetical protein